MIASFPKEGCLCLLIKPELFTAVPATDKKSVHVLRVSSVHVLRVFTY